MAPSVLAIALVAILIGTILQRISGAGVGIVVTPVMVLLMGPVTGVLLTNMTTVMSALMIMITVWSRIDWGQFARVGPAAILGSIPAAILVYALPGPWLQIMVGSVILFAMLTMMSTPNLPERHGTGWAVTAGAIGGFLNTTAGVAAPAMIMYATLTRWQQHSFAATLQPIFLTMGLVSVVTKLLIGRQDFAELPAWWVLPLILTTVFIGIRIGTVLAANLSAARARALAVTVAGIGAAASVIRGVFTLIS